MIEIFFTKVFEIPLSCDIVVLETDRTNFWRSDIPVKTVFGLKKLFALLCKTWPMQLGSSKFL